MEISGEIPIPNSPRPPLNQAQVQIIWKVGAEEHSSADH